MTSLLESSRKSSFHVAFTQITSRILGMVATVILARELSVDDYGVYNLFLGSVLIFNFFTNFGLAGSLQRFLPEYARLEKKIAFLRTFSISIGFRLVSGVFIFTAAVLLFEQWAGYFNVSAYKNEFVLLCLGTYFLFQIDFLQLALNSLFLHGYSNLGQLTYQTLRLVLLIFFLIFLEGKLRDVLTGELLAYGFGALLFWFFFIRKAYVPMKQRACGDGDEIEWKRLLRYSAYNAATIPGAMLFSHAADFFLVAAMATTNQLGIYALGSRAANMLLSIMPQNLLQTVVRPVFYHRYYSVEDKNRELNLMFRSLVTLIAAVLIPVLSLVSLQAEPILAFVFKSKFAESTQVFLMFLVFNIFTLLELPSDLVLQAIEKVQLRLYAQVFAVYNIVAAVLLMSKFGILGVAFATGSALMCKCLFWYLMARHYTGITICWGSLLKIIVNTVLAAVAAYLVGRLGDTPVWMFASLAAGASVYAVMSLVNTFLDNREKELVNRLCNRQVFKV